MKPGELQRRLVELGLNHEQAAHLLGLSRDHVRALCGGRDVITERVAADVLAITHEDAATARLELWMRNEFITPRATRMRPRR